MSHQEEINKLEHKIAQLGKHITEQDGEMFRQSKRIDALTRRCEKLEGRLGTGSTESPIDTDASQQEEKPPHY